MWALKGVNQKGRGNVSDGECDQKKGKDEREGPPRKKRGTVSKCFRGWH